jgi:prevent-host-death family protein
MSMKKIAAAKFKEQCLAILDHLETEGIVVTKHGRPVARVIPFRDEPSALIGALRGRVEVHGNILGTGVRWDASD